MTKRHMDADTIWPRRVDDYLLVQSTTATANRLYRTPQHHKQREVTKP